MNKHAYLIIAHHQFDLLEKIIRLLDDERNDFYIHIDKKVANFDYDKFKSIPQFSKIEFVPAVSVTWGGYSQIQSEINLLKSAIGGNYDYYHLISGADMPIKTKDEIYNFFQKHNGKEFIHFSPQEFAESDNVKYRVNLYHLFQEKIGGKKNILFVIQKILVKLQKLFRVSRLKKLDYPIYCGANWFSITHNTASFLLSKENEAKKVLSHSFCADELFLQTYFMQSPYKDNLFDASGLDCKANMRYVDWARGNGIGNPYVFTTEDFDTLMSTDALFARKFDLNKDPAICNMIYDKLK